MTSPSLKAKHVPQRTCVACRETAAKRQLVRLVRADGVEIDPSGRKPGRGAYLCSDPACWDAAIKKNALERALRTRLTTDDRQRLADYAYRLKGDH